jgi:Amt family ammonium transporter
VVESTRPTLEIAVNQTQTKKRWILPLFLLAFLSAAGVMMPAAPPVAPLGDKAAPIVGADVAWMLVASCLVLLMTPGLAFFYGGMVRAKNVISTMLQSYVAMGLVSLIWIVVGFSLAFGESYHGLIGNPLTFFMFRGVGEGTHPDLSPTIPLVLFALFQMKFAIITPALTTGAFAERIRFSSYLIFLSLFSVLIYAPLAHWTWHPAGFLRQWGVLDFAGGTVVHMSAGFAALAGAMLLGRRKKEPGEEASHHPANIPYVLLGTGMLWVGWFGFNAGSALAANGTAVMAFGTTHMAAASAMLAWIFFDAARGRKISALGASVGAVVGLVAITPAAGFVSIGSSILIGAMASILSNLAVTFKNRSSIDDTLDVFPCHGVGAIFGMIATAVFAKDVGLIHGQTKTFVMHLLALGIVSAFCFGGAYLVYKITDLIAPLRVSSEGEELGLDLSEHDEAVGETMVAYIAEGAASDSVEPARVGAHSEGLRVVIHGRRRGILKREQARVPVVGEISS